MCGDSVNHHSLERNFEAEDLEEDTLAISEDLSRWIYARLLLHKQ